MLGWVCRKCGGVERYASGDCADCARARSRAWAERRRQPKPPTVPYTCSRCRLTLTAEDFYWHPDGKRNAYCRSCMQDYQRERHQRQQSTPELRAQLRRRRSFWSDNDAARTRRLARYREVRLQALTHYGGNPPSCACCGEATYEFLTLDHINNDGGDHRRAIGTTTIVHWLRARDFPPGLQVLCWNCNLAKAKHGVCPHQATRPQP